MLHFVERFFFLGRLFSNGTWLLHRKPTHFFIHGSKMHFSFLWLSHYTRAGGKPVTRFWADSYDRHCMIARRQNFSSPSLHAQETSSLQGFSFRHDWFILSHSITRSSSPTRSFGVRLHSESRKHRCNDFLQKVQNSERTVKTCYRTHSTTS